MFISSRISVHTVKVMITLNNEETQLYQTNSDQTRQDQSQRGRCRDCFSVSNYTHFATVCYFDTHINNQWLVGV